MQKNTLILIAILLIWTLYHISFFPLNEVLRVADSFAYLQMSYYLKELSSTWLWSWWFGFVYSLPIAIIDIIVQQDFLSAKIVNIILINISALLLWEISRKLLSENFSYIVLILWFFSPTFLHFNIHVLSENIYIPLFLGAFLISHNISEKILHWTKQIFPDIISLACLLGLMYLTRAEAFIYIWSIGLIALSFVVLKKLSILNFLQLGALFLLSFFIFISPYLIHLHTITGEWGLTNKWASNLRQAELRGIEQMDDAGFERAVAELTPDNTQLIAWFAWGMSYTKPQIEWSLREFITKDPKAFLSRVGENQKKLFTRNIPEIFLGKSPDLYFSQDSRFSHIFFLLFSLFPLILLLYGAYTVFREKRLFFSLCLSFFLPAFLFFTLFFTLNRYFLIFLPLLYIVYIYGLQSIWQRGNDYIEYVDIEKKQKWVWFFQSIHIHKEIYHHIKKRTKISLRIFVILCLTNIWLVYALSTLVYYNIESPKDDYYALKQEAGIWLEQEYGENALSLKIMERFPIVTYYSGSKTRYITPFTENISDIYEYGIYNTIDILVVDSMDFLTYRPFLQEYLDSTPQNFSYLQGFENEKWQKVILYSLQK